MKQYSISEILHEEGIEGVERHLSEEINRNDRRWLIFYILSLTIFGGFYLVHDCQNVPNNYQKVSAYCDSLQQFVDTSGCIHIEVKHPEIQAK